MGPLRITGYGSHVLAERCRTRSKGPSPGSPSDVRRTMATHGFIRWVHYAMCLVLTLSSVTGNSSPETESRTGHDDVIPASAGCTLTSCRNGDCYTVGAETRCLCQSFFTGSRCEHINMAAVTHAVTGSMAVFQWPQPPRLRGYSFIYYELDNPSGLMYTKAIDMADSENSAVVGNLREVQTQYRVCIEDDDVAHDVLANNAVEYLHNCVNVATQPDYHTMAAWGLTIVFCFVVVFLVYWQKDKFELLYFNKPGYLYCPALETPGTVTPRRKSVADILDALPIPGSV